MKFNSLINTFTSGEWSPKMRARTEAEEYGKACEKLINFLPKIQGGAFRRPGTVRVALDSAAEADLQNAVHATAVLSKMIPFITSDGNRRVLCAFDTQPSSTWVVFDAASPTGSGGNPTMGAGTNVPQAAASIKYAQVGDYVFMTNPSTTSAYPPKAWIPGTFFTGNIELLEIIAGNSKYKSVPFLPIQADGINVTLSPSGATGAVTLTASSGYFTSGNADSYFKLSAAGNTAVFKASAYISATQLSGDIIFGTALVGAHGAAAGTSWEESAWSTRRGWPRYVTAYQGRLIFGGNATYPDAIWGSRIGNVLDFMERPPEQDPDFTGYTDDNSRPFTLFPNTGSTGPIVGLSAAKTLMIHCTGGEIVGYGTNGALGPNDVSFESNSSFGANSPMAARANNYSVFVQKGGRRLRDIIYNNDENVYKSMDLMFVADHLTIDDELEQEDKIVEIFGAELDSSIIFAKTQNGRLLALTLDRDYKINAWARIVLGGKSETKSYPMVKSICAIAPDGSSQDRVWMLVQRYTDGANRIFLEYMDIPKEIPTFGTGFSAGMVHAYVDLKMTYNTPGSPTTTVVTGLAYLEGETLQVIADGQYVGEKVVDSVGNITVDSPAESFIFGYKYESTIKTLPIELGQQVPGSPQGFIKRIDEVMIKFYLTCGAKYGYKESDLMDIGFKDPAQIMNQPPTFFTGYKLLKFPGNYEREAQVIVKTDKPWPCNVLAIISKGILYD